MDSIDRVTRQFGSRAISRRAVLGAGGVAAASALVGAPLRRTHAASRQTVEMWVWETEAHWKNLAKTSGLLGQFPDVDFKFTALASADLHQKALTALAAGLPQGLPSIIRINMAHYRTFANTGGLQDLTESVAPHEQEVLPGVWAGIPVDGKIYQAPDDTGVELFGYRKDIFAQAGLPTAPAEVAQHLATYDDLIATGKTLQDKAGAKLFNMTPDNALFSDLILQDSTGYFDQDGNVIFDSDYHVQVAEICKRIWDSKLTTSFDQDPQRWQQYKDGKLAVMFYPNWQDFVILDAAPETKGKWLATKLPAVISNGKRAHSADGCALVVPAVLPDDQKKLATDVALYLKFNLTASVAHMNEFSGAFVSYVPGLEAMKDTPSPVLDGQKVYEMYLDAARTENILPWYRTSTFFPNADEAVSNAMFQILKENKPIQPALKQAADAIRAMQESKGVK